MKGADEYKRRKEQRQARRLAHECTRCGVPLDEDDVKMHFVTCKRCRRNWRLIYYPNCQRALHRRAQADRGMDHDCWTCGKKLPEGYTKKKCAECIEKSRQTLLETNRRKRLEGTNTRRRRK